MLALFTKSWRKKAAIIALVFYALGIAAPLMQVSAVSQPRVRSLLGHGSDPIDRPPRSLLSI